MILAGDEVLQTQRGNNNAYCQDNDLSWFDWNLVERNTDMLQLCSGFGCLSENVKSSLHRRRFLTGESVNGRAIANVTWHGNTLNTPQWNDSFDIVAYTLAA